MSAGDDSRRIEGHLSGLRARIPIRPDGTGSPVYFQIDTGCESERVHLIAPADALLANRWEIHGTGVMPVNLPDGRTLTVPIVRLFERPDREVIGGERELTAAPHDMSVKPSAARLGNLGVGDSGPK